MFDLLAGVLAELYKLWPSFGGAIILFTALIMLGLSPLSIKSTRSMLAMQRVGPEIKKLQAKHKGDREALNREMMAFYQEHHINPFSSCLPLLLQIPVFIVLYQVLIGLTRRVNPADPTSNFNPKYFEGEDTPLAVALRSTNRMLSFGMDLSQSALSELRSGVLTALPFIILVGLVVVTAIVQQRQIQGRNPTVPVNPQQQMITKIMPFIFIPISVSIPAGVVIYFVVSNLVRIGQQALVTRLEFKDGTPKPTGAEPTEKPAPSRSGKSTGGEITGSKDGRAPAKNRGAKPPPAKPAKSAKSAKPANPANKSSARTKSGDAKANGARRPKASTTNDAGRSNGSGPSGSKSPALTPRPRKRKKRR